MNQTYNFNQPPCFYHQIKKDDNLTAGLGRIAKRATMMRFLAVIVFVMIVAAISFTRVFKLPYLNDRSISSILFSLLMIIVLVSAVAALRQLSILGNKDRLLKEVKKLDWYIGETKDYILLANTTYYYLNLDSHFYQEYELEAVDAAKRLIPILSNSRDMIPVDSPILLMEKKHLHRIKKEKQRNIYQMAITEICLRQLEKNNHDFFVCPNFWDYFSPDSM